MSHEIDQSNDETAAAFVTARTDAWHQLGTTLDHTFTAEEAMEKGYLGGWNVRKQPMWTEGPGGQPIEIPTRRAIVRDNPFERNTVDVLGEAGDNYGIVQNEDHAEFLNNLVDESGAHFETAGSLYGGRVVFITMKLPGHINVGGQDPVETYIAAMNSHDGSMSFTTMVTPVRVVCANTMNMALGSSRNIYRVRHSSGVGRQMSQARQALDLSFNYLEEFQEQAERLINTPMSQSTFEEIIQAEFGAPDDAPAGTVTRSENKIEKMTQLFADSITHEGLRETAWAGLNAMTEYADHFSPSRGEDQGDSRARKAVLDPYVKNRAAKLILENA